MMARMRELAPAFIITVGVLFILFMVISDSRVVEIFGARSNNVGSINGKDITYQEFSSFVDRARENQKAQTGQDIDEENLDAFRDQVWDAIVSQNLTEQQIEKFGLFVTDKEVYETIMGPNPPEFLKKNFVDSLGKFNRELYENALRDPRNKKPLIQAEEVVKQQLLSEKLQAYVNAAVSASDGEIRRKYIDQNIKMTADFVVVDISNFSDANISVSNDDMKKYYNDHPDKFKVESQRKIKYVLFPIQATSGDSAQILQNLQNVVAQAKDDTASFKSYVDIYSETPYSKDSLDITALPDDFAKLAGSAPVGSVIGPVKTSNGGYGVYKLYAIAAGKETFVRASHILIQGTDAAAETEANRVYNEVKQSGNFAGAAQKYSKDPGSGTRGGDLGWFGKGRMVKEFEDACFNGQVNVIQKPVKSSFGYHIIMVTGKSNQRYVVERIINSIKPSASTKDNTYKQASDFAYLAEKNSFENEAAQSKLQINESTPFSEDATAVPGIGYNKSIVKFAFDNSINSVSKAFKTAGAYVVLKVSEVIKPGVRKFEDVEKDAKSLVIKEKKLEKAKGMIELVKSKVGDDLAKAPQLYSQAKFATANGFTTNGGIPSVGLEFNFANSSYKAPLNKVIGPIKGTHAYYLIKVIDRTPFDEATFSVQRDGIRDNILGEKKQSLFSQWLGKLKEDAKIVDRRYQFYER